MRKIARHQRCARCDPCAAHTTSRARCSALSTVGTRDRAVTLCLAYYRDTGEQAYDAASASGRAFGHDRAGLLKLFAVPLLPHEEPDTRRDLLDAVPHGEVEGIDFEDHVLEVRQLLCHCAVIIPGRARSVQPRQVTIALSKSGSAAAAKRQPADRHVERDEQQRREQQTATRLASTARHGSGRSWSNASAEPANLMAAGFGQPADPTTPCWIPTRPLLGVAQHAEADGFASRAGLATLVLHEMRLIRAQAAGAVVTIE